MKIRISAAYVDDLTSMAVPPASTFTPLDDIRRMLFTLIHADEIHNKVCWLRVQFVGYRGEVGPAGTAVRVVVI